MSVVVLVAAMIATVSACAATSGSGDTTTGSRAPRFGTALDGPVPRSVLDAPLVDQSGHRVTLDSWRGKTIVLSDVMTLCQETCPLVTASMVGAARRLDQTPLGKDVEFVSLTIDPRRDDLHHLAAYRRQFGTLHNWAVLSGSPKVVNALWSQLGVWRRQTRVHPPYPTDWLTGAKLTTDIAHTDELIFIGGAQRFRYEMEGPGNVSPKQIPGRIYHFMDALGHRNARSADAGAWTPAEVSGVLDWMLGERSS